MVTLFFKRDNKENGPSLPYIRLLTIMTTLPLKKIRQWLNSRLFLRRKASACSSPPVGSSSISGRGPCGPSTDWQQTMSALFISDKGSCGPPTNRPQTMNYPPKSGRGPWECRSHFIKASLTLEAAMVLSIFMFAMTTFLTFFPAMSISMKIQIAMEEAAESAAMYTYGLRVLDGMGVTQSIMDSVGLSGSGGDDGFMSQADWNDLASQAAGMALLHARVVSLTGRDQLDRSCIRGGSLGLTTFGSSVPDEEDRYILKVSYLVKFPLNLGFIHDIPITQTCCYRAWTGADKGKSDKPKEEEEEQKELVYVTENGTVYHSTTSCTYIDLSVRNVSTSTVGSLRNKSGAKYKPCERCAAYTAYAGSVYITDYGTRYHANRDCGGLKRSVKAVEKDSVSLPPCSRCSKKAA